jgi:thiol-disulfide isomerase/thioredoxin
MPFGLIFGAVVFSVLCLWFGVEALFGGSLPGRAMGAILIVLGFSLSLGLLRRQSVARWTGVAASAFLGVVGVVNVFERGDVGDQVVMLAAIATFTLLALPATGDVRRGFGPDVAIPKRRGRALGWTALVSLAMLMSAYGWTWLTQETSAAVISGAERHAVRWLDFASGLDRARAEGKLVLVDFYAEWCGPCKTMDRQTFTDARVVHALEDVVPVRIDSEETQPRNGFVGAALAEEYGVTGYPTLMLLNADGEIVARKFGAQTPRQLLAWIDGVRAAAPDPEKELLGL